MRRFGPGSGICDCLTKFISDVGRDLDIRRSKADCDDATGLTGQVSGNNIYLCDCVFDTLLPDFLTGTEDEEMCAVLSMARTLYSELFHNCGFGDHPDSGCDRTVEATEILVAGLGNRCGNDQIANCSRNCLGDVWWP